MRLSKAVLASALLLPLAALAARRAPVPPKPQKAHVAAACTPHKTPFVKPDPIRIKRTENVEWLPDVSSPKATSWTIAPKDTVDWLFSQRTFAGTPKTPATTPTPLSSAKAGHAYQYVVTIVCKDGTTQTIDPDIIISTS